MIRRRQRDPEPSWRPRFDAARSLVEQHGLAASAGGRLGEIERALLDAEADRARLTAAVAELAPERAAAELKHALREQQRRPSPAGEALVATLRRRHQSINDLLNQRDRLATQIETTIVDLEALAARAVELSASRQGQTGAVSAELDRLHVDLTALEQAHAELRDL